MAKTGFKVWFFSMYMLTTILLLINPVDAAQFSADMVLGEPGKTLPGKLYVKGEAYRMELQEDNRDIVVIVDGRAGLTRVLVPSEKVFLEMENKDMRSMMNNPFLAFRYSQSRYETQTEGKETVSGYDCVRQLVRAQGKDIMTAWIPDKLGFPVKIVNHLSRGRFVELKNIKEGDPGEGLFQPPAGYTRMDRMPVPLPAWAGDVPGAPGLSAPFEKTLSAKEIVRVPFIEGYKIKVGGKSVSDGRAAFTAVAFKDGRPVKDPSMSTFNLSRKGQGMTVSPRETSADADEMVIRVREGTVLITAELVEAPEGVVLQKHYVKNMSGKELYTETDRPFRLVIRDDEKDETDTRGQLTLYTGRAQHKKQAEQFDLNIKNGESRTWQYPADRSIGTISFSVMDGGIHVRLEQPEKAGVVPPSWTKSGKETGSRVVEEPAGGDSSRGVSPETAPVAIMFILDASGSMWGRVEGRAKIEIAKEVMTELIKDLPDNAQSGLVAYGHRRKGDCKDVEELVPLQSIDKKALTEKIKAINPKGKTPITLSVQKTAEKLKTVEDETIIILVSDGKETCEGDPCALVKELKEAGIRFTMHVIGFDVTEEEREQLECMATAGGGEYFTAKTAQEFRVAAQKVVKESRNIGYLKVTALRNGKPVNAHMEVFPRGRQESITSGRTEKDPKSPGSKLKPGIYDLLVVDVETATKPEIRIEGISVEAGMTAAREVEFSSGALRVSVLKGGKPSVASVRVKEAGTENMVTSSDTSVDNPLTLHLLPGTYDVVVQDVRVSPPQEVIFSRVIVAPGGTVEKTADFSEGFLSVEVLVEGRKDTAGLYVYEAGTDTRVTTGDTSRDNPRVFKLVPGMYDLKVVYGKSRPEKKLRFEGIEVKAGETVEKRAEFSEGFLSVEVLVNGQKGSAGLYVYEAGTDRQVNTGDTSRDNPRVFKLVPGMYDLRVDYRRAKPEREVRFDGIEIKAGETVERRAEFSEGFLSVEVLVNGQKGSAGLYVYEAGTDRRVTTGDTSRDNPKTFALNPDTYDLKVSYKRAIPETETMVQDIQVATGRTAEKRLEFQEGILEVRSTSGGEVVRSDLKFFNPGEEKRFGTGNAGKKIRMLPGDYEVLVRAYKLPDKPEKRVSFSIQAGQTTVLEVDF